MGTAGSRGACMGRVLSGGGPGEGRGLVSPSPTGARRGLAARAGPQLKRRAEAGAEHIAVARGKLPTCFPAAGPCDPFAPAIQASLVCAPPWPA